MAIFGHLRSIRVQNSALFPKSVDKCAPYASNFRLKTPPETAEVENDNSEKSESADPEEPAEDDTNDKNAETGKQSEILSFQNTTKSPLLASQLWSKLVWQWTFLIFDPRRSRIWKFPRTPSQSFGAILKKNWNFFQNFKTCATEVLFLDCFSSHFWGGQMWALFTKTPCFRRGQIFDRLCWWWSLSRKYEKWFFD